VTIVFNF